MSFYDHLEAIILSTDDLERTKEFYCRVFDADWVYQDDVSAMFRAGSIVSACCRATRRRS